MLLFLRRDLPYMCCLLSPLQRKQKSSNFLRAYGFRTYCTGLAWMGFGACESLCCTISLRFSPFLKEGGMLEGTQWMGMLVHESFGSEDGLANLLLVT